MLLYFVILMALVLQCEMSMLTRTVAPADATTNLDIVIELCTKQRGRSQKMRPRQQHLSETAAMAKVHKHAKTVKTQHRGICLVWKVAVTYVRVIIGRSGGRIRRHPEDQAKTS